MITIKSMKWSDWFSYGDNNYIDFTENNVTQITGKNGSGKSSIPVILGEILYGKNAFGKVKQKLFNRYLSNPVLSGTILFEKNGINYIVEYSRKSTLKLTLIENGVDISSHSSTNTLKTLNDILGFDFKLFWQLVYQSSTVGLEFLTATDTNRKKFLINLFNLDKYLTIHEQFKKINTEVNNELLTLRAKLSTIESWIKKHEKEDLTIKELEKVPSIDKKHIDELTELKLQLANLSETNKKINDNNLYKKLLKELDTSILNEPVVQPKYNLEDIMNNCTKVQQKRSEYKTKINILENEINKIEKLSDECPTCTQYVNETFKKEYITEREKIIETFIDLDIKANEEYNNLISIKQNLIQELNKQLNRTKVENELKSLLSKIDESLPSEIIDENLLNEEIQELHGLLELVKDSAAIITARNLAAESHNSKVKVIKEQLIDYKEQLNDLKIKVDNSEFVINKIGIIKKAFSTNGLLNYKIEYLVKDLEYQINTYLEDLSSGRFQLMFALNGEKLDIDIIDDGKAIGIEELSAGELARINTATLLAIRKLMAAISSTKLNILFLDEIMGVLDDEGKEKLIDILNAEPELNTYLVSHEFTHPLIPKINIIKEKKISRIENG